jgi:NADH-quinone oxidoreductase subunit D
MTEQAAALEQERAPALTPMVLNMGPQHPSTHGVLRLILELDGENVVSMKPDIGYLHTGFEKSGEKLRFQQACTLTDRMDYLSPLTNNLAYVLAVERLLGIEVPERARTIRVLFSELGRIASHLVWLGTHAMDIGAMGVFFYCFRQRERILDFIERVSGVRLNPSYFRVGGLMRDLPPGLTEDIQAFVKDHPAWMADYDALLRRNPIWLERLRGVAVLDRDTCLKYGVTGPILRAAGDSRDLRRTAPYLGYETYAFDVPTGEHGDAYDRYQVRMREMAESLKIVQQALDRLEPGPIWVDDGKIAPPPKERIEHDMEALIHHFKVFTHGFQVPAGEAYAGVEGPRGEIGFYVVSDGGSRPYRFRPRTPSFFNLQALPEMCRGSLVADVITAIGSIDIVLGDVDR